MSENNAEAILTLNVNTKSGEISLKKIAMVAKKAAGAVKDIETAADSTDKALKKSGRKFLSNWEKGIIVANQAAELFNKVRMIATAMSKPLQEAGLFESYRITIKNLTGDIDVANARFKEMVQFAATTPFTVPGIVEAGNRLEALGRYSLETIRNLGDLAAASGKDVMQAVEAYTNLVTGRTGIAIKQFRAMLISTNDWTNKIGKSVLKTGVGVKASVNEMLEALPELIAEKGFGGLMDEQSKTFLGIMSNLEDAWQRFLAQLGAKGLEGAKDGLVWLIETLEKASTITQELVGYFKTFIMIVSQFALIKIGTAIFSWINGFLIAAVKLVEYIGAFAEFFTTIRTGAATASVALRALGITMTGWVGVVITVATGIFFLTEAIIGYNKANQENLKDILALNEANQTKAAIDMEEAKALKNKVDLGKEYSEELLKEMKALQNVKKGAREYFNIQQKVWKLQNKLIRLYPKLSNASNTVFDNPENVTNFISSLTHDVEQADSKIQDLKDHIEELHQESAKVKVKINLEEFILKYDENIVKKIGPWAGKQIKEDIENFLHDDKVKNVYWLTDDGIKSIDDSEAKRLEKMNKLKEAEEIFFDLNDTYNQLFKTDAAKGSDFAKGFLAQIDLLKKSITNYNMELYATTKSDFLDKFTKSIANLETLNNLPSTDKKSVLEKLQEDIENFKGRKGEVEIESFITLSKKAKKAYSEISIDFIKILSAAFNGEQFGAFNKAVKDALGRVETLVSDDEKSSLEAAKKRYKKWAEVLKKLKEKFASDLLKIKDTGGKGQIKEEEELRIKYYKELHEQKKLMLEDYSKSNRKLTSKDIKLSNDYTNTWLKDADKIELSLGRQIALEEELMDLKHTSLEDQKEYYENKKKITEELLKKSDTLNVLSDDKELKDLTPEELESLPAKYRDMYMKLVEKLNSIDNEIIKERSDKTLTKAILGFDPEKLEQIVKDSGITEISEKAFRNIVINLKKMAEDTDVTAVVGYVNSAMDKIDNTLSERVEKLRKNSFLGLGKVDERDILGLEAVALKQKYILLKEKKEALKVDTAEMRQASADNDKQLYDALKRERDIELDDTKEAIKSTETDIEKNTRDAIEATVNLWIQGISSIGNVISGLGNLFQTLYQNELNAMKRNNDAYIDMMNERLDKQKEYSMEYARTSQQQSAIDEEYQKRKEAMEKRAREKEIEIKRKMFYMDKASQLAMAAINTAVAITKVAAFPWLIAAASVTGALQIATIAAQEFPGYFFGGYTGDEDENKVVGVTHGKEFVVKAQSTKKYRPLLEALNSEKPNIMTRINNGNFEGGTSLASSNIFGSKGGASSNRNLEGLFNKLLYRLENPIPPNLVVSKNNSRRIASIGIGAIKNGV